MITYIEYENKRNALNDAISAKEAEIKSLKEQLSDLNKDFFSQDVETIKGMIGTWINLTSYFPGEGNIYLKIRTVELNNTIVELTGTKMDVNGIERNYSFSTSIYNELKPADPIKLNNLKVWLGIN